MQRHFIDIQAPEVLALKQDEAPEPGPEQILIAVDFAGVNRADVLQRLGLYPVPPDASPIMGLEVAGTVAAVGSEVEGFAVGQRVCALVQGGGYANFAVARADHVLQVPDNLSQEQAAALPEALLTVWHNVFKLGGLTAGETVLIQGGGSGIGSVGVQMAKARGARVISTAGGPEKCQRVLELGAEFVVDYRSADMLAMMQTAGYAGNIDVILDIAGGDFMPINFELAAPDGRIVCIGVMRGSKTEIDLFHVLMKRLTLTGSTLRGMGPKGRAQGFEEIRREIMPLVTAGNISPIVHEIFPLADAMAAHSLMQSGVHVGKILLDCRH